MVEIKLTTEMRVRCRLNYGDNIFFAVPSIVKLRFFYNFITSYQNDSTEKLLAKKNMF